LIMNEKLKYTRFQRWVELLCVAVLFFLFAFLVSNWSGIPASIPSHYDANGVINGWSSKNSLLLFPVICLVMYALLTAVSFFPKIWNVPVKLTDENRQRVYTVTRSLLCVLKLTMLLLFTAITVSMAKMREPGVMFFVLLIGGVFGVIGGFIVRIIKVSKPQDSDDDVSSI
jgi:uncharacterized membrane protein